MAIYFLRIFCSVFPGPILLSGDDLRKHEKAVRLSSSPPKDCRGKQGIGTVSPRYGP